MDLALSFYKTAKADLRIAKLLHDNSEFPNSIYHFQQAVEKLSKAFGLKNNFIESKNIESKISHRSEKVFTKHIAKTQKEFDKITEIESLFPDFLNLK